MKKAHNKQKEVEAFLKSQESLLPTVAEEKPKGVVTPVSWPSTQHRRT